MSASPTASSSPAAEQSVLQVDVTEIVEAAPPGEPREEHSSQQRSATPEHREPADPKTDAEADADADEARRQQLSDSASAVSAILLRGNNEFGSGGFAGVATFVQETCRDGAYVFGVDSVKIRVGECVRFRWFRPGLRLVETAAEGTEPILVSGRHSDPSKLDGQGAFDVVFEEEGEFHFALEEPHGVAVCTVIVKPADSIFGTTVAKFVVGAVVAGACMFGAIFFLMYWAREQAFLSGSVNKEDDASQYEGLKAIEDAVIDKTLPWVAFAIVLLLLALIVRFVLCCRSQPITAYGKGYPGSSQFTMQMLTGLILLVLGGLILALWWYLLKVSLGYASLFHVLNDAITNSLNEVVGVINNLQFIIDRGPGLLPLTIPDSARTLLTEVRQTATNIRVWTDNGDSLIRGLFRALSIMSFLGLQFILYTCSGAFAAIRERKPQVMRSANWSTVICIAVAAICIGILSLIQEVVKETYETSVQFQARTLTVAELQASTGASSDSPLIQMFGACSDGGVLSVGFLSTVIADVVGNWNGGTSSSQLHLPIPNGTFSTVQDFSEYADFFSTQLDALDATLAADPAAFADIIPAFRANTAPVLRSAIAVGKSLLGLIDCRILRDTFGEVLPVLKSDVIDNVDIQIALLVGIFAMLVALIIVGSIAAYVFARPLKFYYEAATNRWFRFSFSLRAHQRVIARTGVPEDPPAWDAPSMCTQVAFVLGVYTSNIVNGVMVCLQAAMLLLMHYSYEDNKLPDLLQVVAFCCALAPIIALPTESIDFKAVRIVLRVIFLVAMMVAAALSIVYATKAGEDSHTCYNEIQEQRAANNETVYPFSANCTLDTVVRNLEIGVYSATVGVVCLLTILTTGILLCYPDFRAVSSLHAAQDAREEDAQVNREERKRQRKRRQMCCTGLLFVLLLAFGAITVIAITTDMFGEPPASPARQFKLERTGTRCNGYEENCNRRVNEVIWATSHNSFSTLRRNYIAPNHYYDFDQQLDFGFRGFMMDLWEKPEDPYRPYLCHKFCNLGATLLEDELRTLREFLEQNPREVVVLMIEQGYPAENVSVAFANAGTTSMLWAPTSGLTPADATFAWPTLGELIAANQRILVFTDAREGSTFNPSPAPAWLLYMWDYWTETHFAVQSVSNFACEYNRGYTTGMSTGTLRRKAVVLNHFLTAPLAAPYLASSANAKSVVSAHFRNCSALWGRVPNAIALDFWSVSEPLRTLDEVNRQQVLAAPAESDSD